MQLFVISMHRSGSSVASRLLNMLGAYFGAEGSSTAANEENPKGFWERRDIRALNDRLLFSVGCDWNRVATFDFDTIPAETLAEARREAQRIILDLDAHRPWVLKEPRFCLTLPLYRPFLEMPVAIVVHRDPIEVAMSLRHRNGLSLLEGVGLWEAYARSAWAATEGMPRIVIRHAEVMSDPVGAVNDLHDQLVAMGVTGLRRPSEAEITAFIDADLYRQRRKERDASGLLNGMQAELAAQFATGPADQAIDSKRSPGGQMALEHLELRLTAEADRAAAVEAAVAEERAKKPPPPEPTPVETLLENLESTLVDKMQSTLVEKMESRLDARLDAQQQAELDASAARDAKAEAVREEMDNVRQEMGRVHDGMGQVREEMGRVQDEMNGLSHDQQSELTQISSQLANILAQREYEQLEASLRAEANDAQLRATILQERMRTLLHFVDALWNGYQSLEGELSRRGATSHDAIELADDAARLVRSFQEDLAITQGTAAWRFGSRITDFIGRIARLPKSALHDRIVEHGAAADGLDRKRETVRQRLPERDDAGRMAVVRENRHLRPVYETVRASALAQLYGLQDRFVPETSLAVILLPPYGRKLLDALLGQLQLHAAYRGYELFIGESATEVAQKWARQLPIRLVPDDDTPNLATWINRCVALSEADVLCLMETRLRLFQDPLSPLVRAFAESGADYVGVAPLEESKEQVDRVSGIAARIGFDGSRGVALAPEPVDLAIAAEAAADLTPFATPLAVRREAFVRVGGLCTDYEAGDALEDFLLKLRFDEGLRGHLLTNLAITARGILKLERKAARDAAVLNARFGQRLRRHFFERLVDRPVSVVGRPFAVAFAVTDCDSAGDYLTARELGQALQEHHGWTVRYLPRDSWYDLEGFDVVVAMIDEFDPPSIEGCDAHLLRIAWARNWFDRLLEQPGSDDFDLFLSASVAGGRQANRRLGHRARTFRIATSDTRFATAQASGGRDIDYLFSGSNWGAERDITRNLRPADLPWQGVVLGRNWEEFEPFREIYRGFADYEELPNWYARTKIVIDDANHVTREWGSVNSRVYDALAAGALVLTNSQQSSDDVFDGMLPVYDSPESLAQLLDRFLNDEPQRLKLARRLRGIVLKRHTYARRAEEFQRFVTEHFAAPLRIGIKVPCPDRGERDDWGDTYFARTLARIFREQGLAARLDFLPEWRRPAAATDDVVLVLRGLSTYEPRPGQVNLMWNISHPDQVADDEYEAYDHVFVASASHAAALSERLDVAVSPLLQCTDATVFDQDTRTAGDERRPPIFVGNTREQYRKGVRDAIAAELDIEVYGRGWRSLIPDTLIKGDHVPNAELPTYYERAGFVINDHWPSMAEHGFLSNRLFDAGLAGATVISDEVVGLADVFDDLVPTFRSYQSLATVAKALADENEATRTERSNALQRRIRSQHTFEHRVKTIREVIDPLTAVPGLPRDAWEPPSPGRARARLLTPEQRALLRDRSLRRLTVAVIAWDVGHNPIGRAYMLAEALARHFHVVLLGPSEPRYGNGVWPPLKQSSRLSIVTFPARSTDDMMAFYQRIAPRIDADVVLACKPRLPSVSLGLQLKAATPRPLIIDVDDHELSFFPERTALPLDAADIADTELPFGQGWTRVCESLVPTGDLVLVSNPALQDKFGGTIVPHARDEDRFDPERYDRGAERQRLGLPDKARVVLFLGTPREHKGLTELLEAVLRQPEDVVLCVIGSFDNRGYRKQLEDRGGDRLFLLPDQPFEDLPHNLAVADAICLMQRTDHPISAFQLPAKLIDAIAMGIPVLVTPTPPVLSIIEAGLAIETSAETLADDLGQALAGGFRADPDRRRAFLREFSYRAINETMVPKFMALLRAEQTPPNADARAFLDRWPRAIDAPAGAADGLHLVFLWKQNDSGLYGRRVDMLARYALADPRVASVAMVDAPVSINQVRAWESKGPSSQFGHVAELLWRKRWGLMDADRMSWHSFVYEDAAQRHPDAVRGYATADAFPGWLREELQRTGRDPAQTVFVTFPVGEHMLPAIEACGPRAVIADVVDDQRTWPGLDEAQVNAIAAQYATILERANAVMTNCEPVQASMREFVSDIALIPNAAEPTRTNGDLDGPPELAGVNGPVVGYVGNFEPAKFDEGLVRRLAEAHADWQFVLIGSTHMNPDLINRMGDLANILFPGVIPYDELPAWVAQLDCAIIPHLDTEQTRSMNPLKSYVYAAAGVPIVSTAVANLAALDDDHLTIAKDAEAFARAVAERIARGREARFEVPADQCWPERVSRMLGLIDDALATSAREAS